jgi:hypothetical protein
MKIIETLSDLLAVWHKMVTGMADISQIVFRSALFTDPVATFAAQGYLLSDEAKSALLTCMVV